MPESGYVAVRTVAGHARPVAESNLAGRAGLRAAHAHAKGAGEWVVPVEWITTASNAAAVWHEGMFANQNSA